MWLRNLTILLLMITSVISEDCVKMEDPKYLYCKLLGNNQDFNIGLYKSASNQSVVKELRINGFVLTNLSNAFVNLKTLDKIFITNCTGLSSKGQSFSNQQLSSIEITSSDLEYVSEKMFSKLNELKTLKMNNNTVKEIHKDAFKELLKLESIEMDQNYIETLPDDVFVNNLNLKNISFQDNKIQKLTSKTFSGCIKVSEIRLQNNWINEIVVNFDKNLSLLQSIYLKGNICINTNLISKQNWVELKQCHYNYRFNQNLTNTLNEMNLRIITINSTEASIVKSTVNSSVNSTVNPTVNPIANPIVNSTVSSRVCSTLNSTANPIANPTVNSTVNPIYGKVIESVDQLEHEITQLRESKSRHQYFIYFVLLLLTAVVIYGYLFMFRSYYRTIPIATYNNGSDIQLL